jgi:glycosyltransferase involved in cell wall biosynthesis
MATVLNKLGYVVDVIDRTADLNDVKKIEDVYDIFIGLGVGDSGQYFADIAERVPNAIKVLYAMGPEPDLSNRITKARHDYFRQRHPDIPVQDRRLILNVDTERLYKNTDAIIALGNEFSIGSYRHLGKPLHRVYLSTYPGLHMQYAEFAKKDPKTFLYFGGNGNITKGLDLVLEVFAKRPDLTLYIGAPSGEEDFNAFANPIISASPNIHHLGFVDVTSGRFNEITAVCGYGILPSSSEGCATSVTTCMRRGVVPAVTVESGIESVEDFGYLIPEGTVESVAQTVDIIVEHADALQEKAMKTYIESFKYTQDSYRRSLEEILITILAKK